MTTPKKTVLNRKVVLGAIAISAIGLFYLLVLLNGLSYNQSMTITPKANLTVIAGPQIPTLDMSQLSSATPTISVDAQLTNGNGFRSGSYVQITGTGSNGLRIRNNPGTNAEINFVANESEVFQVIGGPIVLDNFTWWQLSTPYDQNRQGWAAAEYLIAVTQ
ncbi:MAG: hypothetical protein FD147_84 [Chloroflexi bacterium]|nr:MAG: hypothetical protein FD147_84 [Chloroflexota bacterium]MBA4374712.1 hypothetical protein [Anaerolinea sp.]